LSAPDSVPPEQDTGPFPHRPSSTPADPDQTPADVTAVAAAEFTPRSFGKYRLLAPVAQGGMGVVYRAHDPTLGRVVALKMMRAGVLAGPEEVQRFYREARAIAQLQHPHIVPVHEVDQCEGQHYFTMAFAPNGSLAEHLDDFRGDARRAVGLVEKIARAVAVAHTRGILHRDLKPGNILLGDRLEPMVSDFGLAKFLDEGEALTQPGQVLGTTSYMSPEQAAGQVRQVSERSDVWSLGVILFELLAGRRPFVGEGREEVRLAILHTEAPPLRSLRPDLPGELEAIVAKCLEKSPESRYASPEELADDLGHWLRAEPSSVRSSSRHRPPWPRRRRLVLVATLVALALLGAGVLWALYYRDPERALDRKLAGRAPVALVGPSGGPAWSRWVRGQSATSASYDADGAFTLSSWNDSMLLLVADPRRTRYRLRAEIRHLGADDNGHVGLFFLDRQQETPRGTVHHCYELSYNDLKEEAAALFRDRPPPPNTPLPKGNYVRVEPRFYGIDGERTVFDHGLSTRPGRLFRPAMTAGGGPWRAVSVEVTPERVWVYWCGEPIAKVPAALLARETEQMLEGLRRDGLDAGLDPDRFAFSARQGLGIYIANGSASFRNVVLEPTGAD
jgi:serine/threonine protein kinase